MTDQKMKSLIERIGLTMARYRVLAKSRLITRMTLGRMGADLDIAYLDMMELVGRCARKGQEVTVGTVAELMRIDPSRASRAVAQLVDQGYFHRDVSQEDARRSVLFLTDKGQKVLHDKVEVKLGLISRIVEDWPEEDIARFADLYGRFLDDFERVAADQLREQQDEG
ncbi:MarR family winged helix-turn-helix transcriptional regulator [Roseibium litorale]|uniref:Winged helix-turn-helix transcriptional regulator n=1 Tax=Roseibium litorale TaxID=2803841 RepID=A0ABR9CR05_9HYPH|nr:MarR family winged helix-turn-helix transcriptional regulator [Roseibium litorale]MBD8893255.1 winged helix-turn-helix transcriptional regulator [Roseibium litorale]